MDVGAVMDQMAERLRAAPSLEGRTFAYPPGSVTPPAAIVSYPEDIAFDATYGRGMDTMVFPVAVVVGRPSERATRDSLAQYMNGEGAESVKAMLDGDREDGYTACDDVRVAGADTDVVNIGGIDYLAVVFSVNVAGRGTAA